MAARTRSNPLALAVLACLVERPMHPYEMASTMRSRGQHESLRLNYGSLYTVVDSLASRGLIDAGETSREGRRPERTVYTITDAGHTEFIDWLTELLGTPTKEYPQYQAGLSLIGHLEPEEAATLLAHRAHSLEIELARIESTINVIAAEGIPRLFLVEVELERALRQAELEFTRKLHADITSGSIDGYDDWLAFHGRSAPDAPTSRDERIPHR
jgi:DNA-binding PadR family transcriptional regulator